MARPGRTRSPSIRYLAALTAVLLAALDALGAPAPAQRPDRVAYSVDIAQDIEPLAERKLKHAIREAERQRAALLIVRLDTPGGEVDSMRTMVRDIVGAAVPVVVYVHPSGGRADSAGVPITLAADVAAMAPATNIGSATPVWAGPPAASESEDQTLQDLRRKAINGAVGLVRTLAEDHGRNADLAERMIRQATNVSARRALGERLVDVVAADEPALLRRLDGFVVKGRKAQTLRTADLRLRRASAVPEATTSEGDLDDASLLRSFAYALAPMIAVGLVVLGVVRLGPRWRRHRRMRRRRQLMERKNEPRG